MSQVEDLVGKTDKPAKKSAAEKPAKAAPAKKAAAKTEDLLGTKPKAKKEPAEKPAKAAPAKKAKAEPAEPKAKRERVAKPPVEFAEGEREELIKKIGKLKAATNSRDLATKLGVDTRKLRTVLYSAERQGLITLELAGSRVEGMTVTPVAK